MSGSGAMGENLCPLRPQVNHFRDVLDLSGLWEFQPDPENVGEAGGYALHLPKARLAAVPGSWNEQFSELRDYLGHVWYLKQVSLPRGFASAGRAVFIRVGSACYAASVFIDGRLVGSHEGGHLPFQFDITDLLSELGGAAGGGAMPLSFTVAIRVEALLSPQRVPPGALAQRPIQYPSVNFDFFPYGGIHRAVTLVSLPKTHIKDITVRTVSLGPSTIAATVEVTVAGVDPLNYGRVSVSVTNPADPSSRDTPPLDTFTVPWAHDPASTDGKAVLPLTLKGAQPWSPASPQLYDVTVRVDVFHATADPPGQGEFVDAYTLRTGFRTIEVKGDSLLLNGAPLFLSGFGRHEDFPALGKGHCSAVSVKDNALVRWAGGNSFRTSHYPYDEECMELADREGLCVIDETPAVYLCFHDSDENIQARLRGCLRAARELYARDKNHPSVVMWSWANEPEANSHIATHGTQVPQGDEWKAKGRRFFEALFAEGRRLDATRPHTLAAHPASDVSWIELCDVVCTNRYNGWYGEIGQLEKGAAALAEKLDREHALLRRPFMLSEFGADAIAGTHADPPEMFSEEYQVEMLEQYLDLAAARPWIVGMHVWNLADFKTAQAVKRPQGLNHKGVFTRDRRPKMAAHALRRRWFREGEQPAAWQGLGAVPPLQNLPPPAPAQQAAAGGEGGGDREPQPGAAAPPAKRARS